jgi:hypothetical protein
MSHVRKDAAFAAARRLLVVAKNLPSGSFVSVRLKRALALKRPDRPAVFAGFAPRWDEWYDDTRASGVIEAAIKGDRDARIVLNDAAAFFLSRTLDLPAELRRYVIGILNESALAALASQKNGRPRTPDRDLIIFYAVLRRRTSAISSPLEIRRRNRHPRARRLRRLRASLA